ncbi:MAG TPA: 6-carboxytetrahydropterin synthase [Gaiellales bacterium]|jgi:6-pyruvoyltetrahydropterin/6-carboxytetrahydropterin synthase
MRAQIRKTFRFEAAHSLPHHAGKCRGLHGHSYRVELCFEGEIKPARGESDDGMVLDFLDVSAWWHGQVEPLVDHRFLNETMPEAFLPTTAENIAAWVLSLLIAAALPVTEVTVWETPSASATVGR